LKLEMLQILRTFLSGRTHARLHNVIAHALANALAHDGVKSRPRLSPWKSFVLCPTYLPPTFLLAYLHYAMVVPSTTLFIGCFATIQIFASLSASFSHDVAHRIKLSRQKSSTSLNLVPLSDAWDASSCNDQQLFSDLVTQLGCRSLDSKGRLIQSATDNDDDANRYRLYLATHINDLPPIAQLTIDVFDATAITLSSDIAKSAITMVLIAAQSLSLASISWPVSSACGMTSFTPIQTKSRPPKLLR